jgi:type I restriction enzyme S subunit
MTPALRPYPTYKPSGVPWLGDVPEHWGMRSFGSLGKQREERGRTDLPLLSVVREKGVVLRSSLPEEENHNLVPDDLTNYKVVQAGDLAINKMKAWQGSLGISPLDGVVSPAYYVYALSFENRGYAHRLLRSRPYVAFYNQASDGVRIGQWDLSRDRLKRSPVLVPEPNEQSAIVRYLDHVDRRIRKYIRAKQKLIGLLNEQKQAIIHRAVTGQIDVRTGKPYPKYKPSGVPWLGAVPEHWEVLPLRRVTLARCDGPFGSGLKSSHYSDQGIRVVRLQNIGHAEFKGSDAAYISPTYYESLGDHSVQAGDILIAGLGDEHHPAGRACAAPAEIEPAMVKADCFRFRLDVARIRSLFAAFHLTATATAASAVLSTGATRQRTNLQSTAARAIALPPIAVQDAILARLTEDTAAFTGATESAASQIDLIREYRTRLVADVVTGKLDVREAAANLPEEADEPDDVGPVDDAEADETNDAVEAEVHKVGE